jgi:transposase
VDIASVKTLLAQGCTQSEAARRLRISRQLVSVSLKRDAKRSPDAPTTPGHPPKRLLSGKLYFLPQSQSLDPYNPLQGTKRLTLRWSGWDPEERRNKYAYIRYGKAARVNGKLRCRLSYEYKAFVDAVNSANPDLPRDWQTAAKAVIIEDRIALWEEGERTDIYPALIKQCLLTDTIGSARYRKAYYNWRDRMLRAEDIDWPKFEVENALPYARASEILLRYALFTRRVPARNDVALMKKLRKAKEEFESSIEQYVQEREEEWDERLTGYQQSKEGQEGHGLKALPLNTLRAVHVVLSWPKATATEMQIDHPFPISVRHPGWPAELVTAIIEKSEDSMMSYGARAPKIGPAEKYAVRWLSSLRKDLAPREIASELDISVDLVIEWRKQVKKQRGKEAQMNDIADTIPVFRAGKDEISLKPGGKTFYFPRSI